MLRLARLGLGLKGALQRKIRSSFQNWRKERVPPSGMKAESKSASISHVRKEWELETGTTAKRTHTISEAWLPSFYFLHIGFPVIVGRSVRKRDEPAEPRDEPAGPSSNL